MFILVISLIITYIRLSVKLWTGTKKEGKSELPKCCNFIDDKLIMIYSVFFQRPILEASIKITNFAFKSNILNNG